MNLSTRNILDHIKSKSVINLSEFDSYFIAEENNKVDSFLNSDGYGLDVKTDKVVIQNDNGEFDIIKNKSNLDQFYDLVVPKDSPLNLKSIIFHNSIIKLIESKDIDIFISKIENNDDYSIIGILKCGSETVLDNESLFLNEKDCFKRVIKSLLYSMISDPKYFVSSSNIQNVFDNYIWLVARNEITTCIYLSKRFSLYECLNELIKSKDISANYTANGSVIEYSAQKDVSGLLGNPFSSIENFSKEDRYLAYCLLKEFDFFFLGIENKEDINYLKNIKDKAFVYVCRKYFLDTLYKYRNSKEKVEKYRDEALKLASWYEKDYMRFVSSNLTRELNYRSSVSDTGFTKVK